MPQLHAHPIDFDEEIVLTFLSLCHGLQARPQTQAAGLANQHQTLLTT
jgi:hypothetical protein